MISQQVSKTRITKKDLTVATLLDPRFNPTPLLSDSISTIATLLRKYFYYRNTIARVKMTSVVTTNYGASENNDYRVAWESQPKES